MADYDSRADVDKVVKLTPEGEKVDAFLAEDVSFNNLWGVAVDGYGNVYVADRSLRTVVKLNREGS